MSSGPGRPRGRTARGEQTKLVLYSTAIRLFAERGYEATTLRAIATEAGVSVGLLYKYFPSKAAVVVELYHQLSGELVERAQQVGPGVWGERFFSTLELSLEVLRPHRSLLRGVLATMALDEEIGLFSPGGAEGRQMVRGCFIAAVDGSTNAPGGEMNAVLGRLLDLVQIGMILFWLVDRSPEQSATRGLVGWIGSVVGYGATALWVPGVSSTLVELDARFAEAFDAP